MAGSDKTVKVRLDVETGPYAKGMASASSATRKLGSDIDNVGGKSKGLGGNLEKATGALKGMAVGGAALAGTALVSFLTDSIQAAGDLQQSIGGVDSVFKDSAETVHAFGKTAAEAVGLSRNEFNQLVTVTGALLKNKGLEDFANKSLDLVKIGADLAAQFGGTTAEAVEALNSALKGETDPIEKYGISLNEAAVQAELAAKGQQNLTGAALDQAKAMARINIITNQSTDAIGTFARESDTLQGQQQRLNAEWEDAKALLGEQLLPLMTQLVETMRGGVAVVESLTGAFSSMPSWLQEILGVIERVISPLTGLLKVLGLLSPEQEKAAESAQKQAAATAKTATATVKVADAAKKAAPEINTLAIRTRLAREAAQAAADAHKELAQAILDISDAAVSADKAQADWQQAIDDATASVKENGKTVNKARTELNLNTQAGRDNQAALIDLRDRAREVAEANLNQGDSVKSVKAEMAEAREEFVQVARKMGLSKKAAEELATQYGLTKGDVDNLNKALGETPKETKARVTAETAAAKTAISGIDAMLTALDKRHITVSVTAAVSDAVTDINNVGTLFGWKKRANGGLLNGPGTATSDSIPVLASNGEYVIKAAAVAKYGARFFDDLNAMRLASGGFVSRMPQNVRVAPSAVTPEQGPRNAIYMQTNDPVTAARQVFDELEWRAVNG